MKRETQIPEQKLKSIWRRWRWRLAGGYLLLVLAAHFARWASPADFPPKECCSQDVQAIDGDRDLDRQIRLAYRDLPARRLFETGSLKEDSTTAPPIVLLHGSPGEATDFNRLVPLLSGHRLIIPDLPGFGGSTRNIPDYSFRAHAHYVNELLDRLKIERAHVVAFSMAGGAALNLSELAPARVASLTMLASIGVQEMELLGDYHLNHGIHGLQLGFFWLLHEGLPWTPAAYARDFSVSYSRNFFDSDQRPLRGLLLAYAGPMLIIHGKKDFLVPVEAAIEHHRLVPQSELALSDRDHFMVFMKSDYLAPLINDFVERVDAGRAKVRSNADSSRIQASREPFDPKNLPKFIGVTALVVILLLAAATLMTEDLTCVAAGIMAAQGRISFIVAAFACFIGIFVGDLLLFLAGRWLGRAALNRSPVKWFVKPEAVANSSDWFSRQGAKVIFASRFLPGARLPTYFAAGALNTSFWKFAFYFFIACAVWTPVLVGLSMYLGKEVIESALLSGQGVFFKLAATAILIYLLIKLLTRFSTWKGRRMLLSSWRRLTRWEFWPLYLFYPPVICYVMWLMLKHRSFTLFTAANPAIPGGGFIGESKAAILRGLAGSRESLPRWGLIGAADETESRIEQVKRFMSDNSLDYPIALKPDAGQRGAGVAIIKSEIELTNYLKGARTDTLVQEYVAGPEFGVFYYRYPGEARGRIFAITEKRFPAVVGDGASTLERLILNDKRAVCQARLLLAQHVDQLWKVPAHGEEKSLVELGTHCRGAMFLDGGWAKTDELENAIDEICRTYQGFHFGRFDLRAPSVEDFQRGKNLKVIELNGVTSEATSIYDPKNSIWTAYRTLFAQWRIAFEIGAQNRARGVEPTSLRTLSEWLHQATFRHRRNKQD